MLKEINYQREVNICIRKRKRKENSHYRERHEHGKIKYVVTTAAGQEAKKDVSDSERDRPLGSRIAP